MAQDLEWFEQQRLQSTVPPARLFQNSLEQPTLFGSRLLKEQFARPTRQAKHIDCLLDGGWRGFLDILNLS